MRIVYLQCDMRYNRFLFEILWGGKSVIEYTLSKCKKLNCDKIVSAIYNCEENKQLIEILKINGVETILSEDTNVNSRFVDAAIKEKEGFMVRIGADQVLVDVDRINIILNDMEMQNMEWFYTKASSCILPDIVSIDCLRKYKLEILRYARYFHALEKQTSLKRYVLPYSNIVLFDFRVNSNEGYRICNYVITNKLNVYELSENLAVKLTYKLNYFHRTGILGSWILGSLTADFFFDEDKIINPWWGRTIIDFIKDRLNKNLQVFEWGTGNSTLFWSHYVRDVVSVEYNKEWYHKMQSLVPQNVRLKYCELEYGGEYCKSIMEEQEKFDIVLIDGRDRVRCAKNAVKKLKEEGVIIWDNTDRVSYKEGYAFLKARGFNQIELNSIMYGVPNIEDYTSVFYREKNILNI